jgi:hypothetical protein
MLERHRRDRSAAPVMRARFPQLATLKLDFDFVEPTACLPSPQVTVLHPPARAFFCFTCPHNDCDGEFDLTQPVELAADARSKHADGTIRCTGRRPGGVVCALCLEYSITAHLA